MSPSYISNLVSIKSCSVYSLRSNSSLSLDRPKGRMLSTFILRDPGADSRAGRKGATKVFKHRRKSPWVPTLTGPFPNGQVNAGS